MNLTCDKILSLLFLGNAIFTIKSGKTGAQYTYKIVRSKSGDPGYVVSQLSSGNRWLFVGTLNGEYWIGCNQNNPAWKALDWFMARMVARKPHPLLSIKFSEKCCRCGRRLTDPNSIDALVGPECRKYM